MKYRNNRDYSPITPSRAAVIRTGMTKDMSLLNSPKNAKLPSINSPQNTSSKTSVATAQKSTFSKKKDNSTFSSNISSQFGSNM